MERQQYPLARIEFLEYGKQINNDWILINKSRLMTLQIKILLLILDLMFINWKYKLNNPQKKKFSLFSGCLLYFSILKQQNYRSHQQSFKRIEIIVIENHNNNTNIHFEEKNYIKDLQFSPDSSLLAFATNKGAFIQDIITSQILQNFQVSKCCLSICFIGKEQLGIVLSGQLVLYDIKDLQQTKISSINQLPDLTLKMIFLEKKLQICIFSQNCIASFGKHVKIIVN
ncbi:unnamed protein product [Paramecium primaurelia]|uniref:Uncharacterized protein n=1 Tax=Paramecium primaurelia TaxID=5886 RepID=A0A8S1P6X9_PARPR|nr:unnamed protein product [Paramecium primaurelia]